MRARAYLLAFGCVAAAAAAHLLIQTWVSAFPFLTFFLAVVAAASYGGLGPGLLATGLSAVAALWVVFAGGPAASRPAVFDAVPRFVFVAVIVTGLIDRLRRAQRLSADRLADQFESVRRAELAQQQLAAIVESCEDAIISWNLDGIIISWNRGAEYLYGYTADEAIGSPITLIVPPDRMAEDQDLVARIRDGRPMEHIETVRRRKDGADINVSITASPIRDASGAIVGGSKIARDITEQQRAARIRDELLAREQRALADAVAARDRLEFLAEVSALLTSSLDYQITLDRAVHVALPRLGDYCNVLVENDHGVLEHVACAHVVGDKEPALRDLVHRLVESPDRLNVPTFSKGVMRTGRPVIVNHAAITIALADLEATHLSPDLLARGEALRPYAYVGVPLFVRGRPIGVMSFGTGELESRREYSPVDLTLVEEFARRVSLAIENARLFKQADELNRLKDEFLATLSHELRTPLAAVLGWARMLVNGQLDADKTRRALQAIERNAQAQVQLVDDILDVARGMAGNLRLNIQPIDVVAVTHRSVEAIAPAAAAKHIDLRVQAPAPVAVAGDAGRLQQVVWNVLSNAVKFTDVGGRITIDVAARNGHAEVEVSDSGVGIPPAFLPYVFDKFRQADGSLTRQHGGLGLGLAIARHLVELHGGSIEACSDGEGRGATFLIRLPAPSAPSAQLSN
jgi:PAS domain S-box-containing protein